ncbi:MAG: hypothetical protein ACT4O0_12280 [Pseudonocardia sp.]|jgi:hypothetical protein
MRSSLRRTTSALTAAVLASTLGLLTACGGGSGGRDSSPTKCDLGGCTVTFVRDGTPEVSILGVTARLIGVQGDQATIEVAGQLITLPVGGETQAEGFTVRVERATDTEVVVRVSP